MHQKLSLLLVLAPVLLYSCKKTDNVKPDDKGHTTKPDTVFAFKNDTLIKTWKDTILKVVKDPLYNTKHDTVFAKKDSVVLIKRIAAQTSKINLFFLGTSITFGSGTIDGVGVVVPPDKAYPAAVSNFFLGSNHYGGWYNYGVPGAIVEDIVNTEIPEVITNNDVTHYTESVALIEVGVNDCASGFAAQDIYNAIKNAHDLLHKKGIQTIVVTPTPFNSNLHSYNHDAVAAEVTRQQLKALLKSGWKTDIGAIALIDLSDDKFVGKFSGNTGFDLNIFQPDGIHFTPLGYSIIAGYAEKTIFYLK